MTIDGYSIWSLLKNKYQQLLAGLGITLALALYLFAIAMSDWNHFGMFN